MRTLVLIASVIWILGLSSCGQTVKDVPATVKSTFSMKFPNATSIKWGRENMNEWEAEFRIGDKEYSANFNNSGDWMETEYQVTVSELPAAVKATIDKESAGLKIKLSEVTETKDGKAFEFVFGKGEDQTELVIDNSGNVIKKEQLEEEDEED